MTAEVRVPATIPADLWELMAFSDEAKVYGIQVTAEVDRLDDTEVRLLASARVDWWDVRRLLAAAYERGKQGKPLYPDRRGEG